MDSWPAPCNAADKLRRSQPIEVLRAKADKARCKSNLWTVEEIDCIAAEGKLLWEEFGVPAKVQAGDGEGSSAMGDELHIKDCIKCGSTMTQLSYCARGVDCKLGGLRPDGRHMDCWCERCGYHWAQPTLDLTGKEQRDG